MQKIPTYWQVQAMYIKLISEGKDAYFLSPLERIILGAPRFTRIQEYIFRRKLVAVLNENLQEPETYEKFDAFIAKYPRTESGSELLSRLLVDARIEHREYHGYPKRSYM